MFVRSQNCPLSYEASFQKITSSKVSLVIRRSVIETFKFNGKEVRSIYVKEVGECLIAKDVLAVIGYNRAAGVQAIQRLVPKKYKMRFGDADLDIDEVIKSDYLHQDTVLLKEPGLYCFLLRCGRKEAERFMEWLLRPSYHEKYESWLKTTKITS